MQHIRPRDLLELFRNICDGRASLLASSWRCRSDLLAIYATAPLEGSLALFGCVSHPLQVISALPSRPVRYKTYKRSASTLLSCLPACDARTAPLSVPFPVRRTWTSANDLGELACLVACGNTVETDRLDPARHSGATESLVASLADQLGCLPGGFVVFTRIELGGVLEQELLRTAAVIARRMSVSMLILRTPYLIPSTISSTGTPYVSFMSPP